MENFVSIKNKDYTAVFINENNILPKKIIPLGIYSLIGGLSELCEYVYLFDNVVTYTILHWETREAKDPYSMSIMKTIIEQQKSFINLIK
jgi:hypothetical protein